MCSALFGAHIVTGISYVQFGFSVENLILMLGGQVIYFICLLLQENEHFSHRLYHHFIFIVINFYGSQVLVHNNIHSSLVCSSRQRWTHSEWFFKFCGDRDSCTVMLMLPDVLMLMASCICWWVAFWGSFSRYLLMFCFCFPCGLQLLNHLWLLKEQPSLKKKAKLKVIWSNVIHFQNETFFLDLLDMEKI